MTFCLCSVREVGAQRSDYTDLPVLFSCVMTTKNRGFQHHDNISKMAFLTLSRYFGVSYSKCYNKKYDWPSSASRFHLASLIVRASSQCNPRSRGETYSDTPDTIWGRGLNIEPQTQGGQEQLTATAIRVMLYVSPRYISTRTSV